MTEPVYEYSDLLCVVVANEHQESKGTVIIELQERLVVVLGKSPKDAIMLGCASCKQVQTTRSTGIGILKSSTKCASKLSEFTLYDSEYSISGWITMPLESGEGRTISIRSRLVGDDHLSGWELRCLPAPPGRTTMGRCCTNKVGPEQNAPSQVTHFCHAEGCFAGATVHKR